MFTCKERFFFIFLDGLNYNHIIYKIYKIKSFTTFYTVVHHAICYVVVLFVCCKIMDF